jgi:putative ABC transport system permease protein
VFGGATCTIVGTLGPGERGALEEDALLTPASFLVRTVGRRLEGSISMSAEVRSDATLDAVVQQIRGILSRRHQIAEGEEPDFAVNRQQDVSEGLKRLTGSTTGIITAVALWSLVIACAGIMNAVLNSVLERVSHIGLQRAVGARRADIRLEYLVEGGAIATMGALLGIALGSVAAAIVSAALDLPQQFDIDAASVALGMSLLLGIAAATWPASHAARLDPAAVLRAE